MHCTSKTLLAVSGVLTNVDRTNPQRIAGSSHSQRCLFTALIARLWPAASTSTTSATVETFTAGAYWELGASPKYATDFDLDSADALVDWLQAQ